MSYLPMAYRTPNLEGSLTPPTGLGSLTDLLNTVTDTISTAFQTADIAAATTLAVGKSAGWCSTYAPKPGCTPIRGIAIPINAATLELFKNLQRAANRMLVKLGKDPIGVDGRIGPGTVKAVSVAANEPGIAAGTADMVAGRAAELTAKINSLAAAVNAPAVADPATSKPSQPTANGGVANPSRDDIVESAFTAGTLFAWMPPAVKTPLGIAAVAFAGFAVYKAVKGPKGKGGRRRRKSSGRRGRR